MLYNWYIIQVHCSLHYARRLRREMVDDLLATVLAVHHVLEARVDALEPTVKQLCRIWLNQPALDKLGHLPEEVHHVVTVLFARREGRVAGEAGEGERTAKRGVDQRGLDFDIGAQALRLLLDGEDRNELATAGAERLHAELLGVGLGDGVEPCVDAVVRDSLDLVDGVRVFVLRMCALVTPKRVETEIRTSKTASAPSDLQSSWFLREAVVATL